jgi:hypothetical protein
MALNQKLTDVIRGRTIQDLQISSLEVAMRFADGSTMQVKVMESNSPPLKNGATIRAVFEELASLTISCEDQSQLTVVLADPGSSVTVLDANGVIEYSG